jgi:hypothetical protein
MSTGTYKWKSKQWLDLKVSAKRYRFDIRTFVERRIILQAEI